MTVAENLIDTAIEGAMASIAQLRSEVASEFMRDVAQLLAETFERRHKLLIAGNGGSLCDASHFAEELTGQFRRPRRALPAIALNDPGHLTCTANDMGFDEVFARGIEALGHPGDCFVGLTTSGKSPNMIRAFEAARDRGMRTVAFLGRDGGDLRGVADFELMISGETSDRIQEAHMAAIHIIIEATEALLFA